MVWFVTCLAVWMPFPEARECDEPALSAVLERLARAHGIEEPPQLILREGDGAPRAVADGFILVFTGRLGSSMTEPALAFALAHEWAHLLLGHPRRLGAATLLQVALGGTGPGVDALWLRLELEADAAALEWMSSAGYPGYASLDALDLLTTPSDATWTRRVALARRLWEE
jgi:Zn-dependent protease with chaperone function